MRLGESFYQGDPQTVAQNMLGKLLIRQCAGERISGIIVEVEAYLSTDDSASHSARGLTRRNRAMFLQAGTLYVYSIHAKFCMNVVTEPAGIGSAILIRALEPWEGVARMREHRPLGKRNQLCSGPARLCQALAIDRTLDGVDLLDSNEVWLEPAPQPVNCRAWQITATGRIGISSGQHHMYRWFIDGHLSVSGLARDHVQKRELLFQPEA